MVDTVSTARLPSVKIPSVVFEIWSNASAIPRALETYRLERNILA